MKYIYSHLRAASARNLYVAILESPRAISGLRMALKMPSFYFDVESGESGPPSRCPRKTIFCFPNKCITMANPSKYFFKLEKLLTGTIYTVEDCTKCLDCTHLITAVK